MAKVFLCALCIHAVHTRRAKAGLHGGRKKKSFGFILVPFHYHDEFNYYQHAEETEEKKCRVLLLRETEQMTKNKALIIIFPPSLTTQLICRPWRTPPPVAARRAAFVVHSDHSATMTEMSSNNCKMPISCLIFECVLVFFNSLPP